MENCQYVANLTIKSTCHNQLQAVLKNKCLKRRWLRTKPSRSEDKSAVHGSNPVTPTADTEVCCVNLPEWLLQGLFFVCSCEVEDLSSVTLQVRIVLD